MADPIMTAGALGGQEGAGLIEGLLKAGYSPEDIQLAMENPDAFAMQAMQKGLQPVDPGMVGQMAQQVQMNMRAKQGMAAAPIMGQGGRLQQPVAPQPQPAPPQQGMAGAPTKQTFENNRTERQAQQPQEPEGAGMLETLGAILNQPYQPAPNAPVGSPMPSAPGNLRGGSIPGGVLPNFFRSIMGR